MSEAGDADKLIMLFSLKSWKILEKEDIEADLSVRQ
jgi:hypothetical protein